MLLVPASHDVTAQPIPQELDRLCRNIYTGALRYVPANQNCSSGEVQLDVIEDMPYTLCVSRFTRAVRFPTAAGCNPDAEIAYPFPESLPMAFCVNRYSGQLRWTPTAGACPDGYFAAAISEIEPVANDDGPYFVVIPNDLTITTADPNDLLDNDQLGFPAATIASFGGGDLGGDAGTNSAGGSAALAGGTLTVNPDGSFSLTDATIPGDYSFDYRLTNPGGSSDATVTIQVQQLPDAADDAYTVLFDDVLTLDATSGLLANDQPGFPEATIAGFGGGTLGGVVTDNAAGTIVTPIPTFADGSLRVNPDGSLSFTPPSGFLGVFSFQYRLQNAAGSDDAVVTIEVQSAPTANADSYITPINVDLVSGTGDTDDLLANDQLGYPPATIVSVGGGSLAGDATNFGTGIGLTFAGGTLTVNADGSFSLVNPTTPGEHTFFYRLQNGIGFSDAMVTIEVHEPPTAVIDSYTTLVNTTLSRAATDSDDLLDNDSLGFPDATLTHFGGGSLGGSVTDNPAGASVPFAGGMLTVNADGSFTLATPATPGDYTFVYRLTNAAGTSDAEVSIQVQQTPDAQDDGPYIVLSGDTLTITTGDANDLLDNDEPGHPPASITNFGGGSLGGVVTDNTAGATVAIPASGGVTVTVGADGSLTVDATAATAVPGDYTLLYRLSNGVGSDDAEVSIQVQATPDAIDDSFSMHIATTLDGDLTADNGSGADAPGFPPATITGFGGGSLGGDATSNQPGTTVTLAGGDLTVNADGSFSLALPTDPGTFTFDYRLENAAGFDVATVTIEVQATPLAEDDGPYIVVIPNALTVPDGGTDLLFNDQLGAPAATLTHFGGGSLGGSVTDNLAGVDSASLAGGTLTVNEDGTFSLTGATIPGDYTFVYRLTNAAGTSDAEVTIQVQQTPDAQNDGPYEVEVGDDLVVLTTDSDDLLDNDSPGFPMPAAIVSFGGGDLGGTVTSNAAGADAPLANGTLTVNADGSFSLIGATTPGVYEIQYRLENAAGLFDDATFTIAVQDLPDAFNDGPYTVLVGETLTVSALDTNHLLVNDDLGTPLASIASFGVDDATAVTAGNTTTLAGGTLQVNADGSFILTNPTTGGTYTFLYRLQNTAGFDDAEVTINVQQAPLAVDDGPADDSEPGDAYHTAFETTLDSSTSPNNENLLANDTLGFPVATLVSFGGGDLGGTASDHAAGSTVSPLPGNTSGSLAVNADGSFVFTPPTGFAGLYTFNYVIENSLGDDTAMVTIAVGERPAAANDTYANTLVGNILIDTSASSGFSVLANDAGDGLSFTDATLTSTNGGDVMLNPDGTFIYNPAPGFEGSDSFTYEIDNDFDEPSQGTVNLTVSGMIWFVNNAAGAGGDGRISAPFNCLVGLIGAGCFHDAADDAAGDNIFVYTGSYDGGLILLDNQKLVGQGAGATLASITGLTPPADSPALPATGGTAPTLSDETTSDNITLASGAQVHGVALRGTARGIFGNGITGATVADVNIQNDDGTGIGLQIQNSSGTIAIDDLTIAQTANGVVLIDNQTATLDFTGATSISASTSAVTATQSGTVNINSGGVGSANLTGTAGTALNVEDTTLTGTITSATATNTAGRGISLDNTGYGGTAPNVSFGTVTLTTTDGIAFLATNFGTVSVTNSASTISATEAGAVQLTSTAIGAGGMTFASVSSTGGEDGIHLESPGGGAFTANGGTIEGATSHGVYISGGTGSFTYAGSISTTTSGQAVLVINHTGGTVLFSGAIEENGIGINLDTNPGATLRFTGGLDIDSVGNLPGFTATGGGTLEVLDPVGTPSNTIDTTAGTGIGLHVSDVTIGAGNLTFQSIATTGASQGINLANTGTSGGLIVTGVPGINNSGGIIQNSTTDGVRLNNTANVSLTEMRIVGSTENNVEAVSVTGLTLNSVSLINSLSTGFFGTTVRNLTITNSQVHGSGDAANENGVHVENLQGTSSVTGTTFQDNSVIHLFIRNSAAFSNPDVLTLSGNTFSLPTAGVFGDNISVEANTTGNLRVVMNTSVGNNVFTGGITGLHAITSTGGTLEVQVTQATISGLTGTGVNLDGNGSSTLRFRVEGVVMTDAETVGINATSILGATLNGTIQNNSVTGQPFEPPPAPLVTGVGIQAIVEGNGTLVVRIHNNQVTNIVAENGIRIQARAGSGRIDATVTNNTVNNPDQTGLTNPPLEGIAVESGSSTGTDTNVICLNMANNNSVVGGGEQGYRLRQRSGTTFLLQDFAGNGASMADVANWVTTTKSNTGTVQVTIGTAFTTAPANCSTPSF